MDMQKKKKKKKGKFEEKECESEWERESRVLVIDCERKDKIKKWEEKELGFISSVFTDTREKEWKEGGREE